MSARPEVDAEATAEEPLLPDAVTDPEAATDPADPSEPDDGPPAGTNEPFGEDDGQAPLPPEQSGLASTVESLLFLSSEPVRLDELAVACDAGPEEVADALDELRRVFAPGRRGLLLRELGGGFLLSSAPETEPAARRLMAAPRTPPLTPAQAETLAIVAYLQPVSRPEITRIRGVAADSACATLVERGMIEEAGRSQFGAVLYRTTGLFLKLFGLDGLADLPDPAAWDPTPEETATLRDRLMSAGDARGGGDATAGDDPAARPAFDLSGAGAAPDEPAPVDGAAPHDGLPHEAGRSPGAGDGGEPDAPGGSAGGPGCYPPG